MLRDNRAFASFSSNDTKESRRFYSEVLGVTVAEVPGMPDMVELRLAGEMRVLIYPKPNHVAATFTVLNFLVADVEKTVDELAQRGVKFEIYRDGPVKTDDRGIAQGGGGPKMAWFKDPAGNIVSVLEEKS